MAACRSDGSFTGEETDSGLQHSLARFSHPGLPPLKITGMDEGEHIVTDEDFLTPDSSSASSGHSHSQKGSDVLSEQIFSTSTSQHTGKPSRASIKSEYSMLVGFAKCTLQPA